MSSSSGTSPPKIARIWRGRTASGSADAYARYLYENGIIPLEEKALGVQLFREDRRNRNRIRDDLLLGEHRGDVALRGR